MFNLLVGIAIGISIAYYQPDLVASTGQWFISIIPK